MKTRVLFVDDDPLVLQGLQRMLRGMRQEWDMEFLDGGERALARMQEAEFDVVISDMRMPGMNGAQLLDEVMRRHPKTVRLILSGHADRDLIMRCVGSTHQYLAKPCHPEDLKLTINRAARLEGSLKNESLRRLVARLDRLPSLPALYCEIVETCRQPEASLDDVANIVSRDIGMTAQMLKLVNSAFFGLGRPITNIHEAVAYLGLETIKALVLSIHALSQFDDLAERQFSVGGLWRHSLAIAGAAKAVALSQHADRRLADEAFVAGLLHDAGKLVLSANFPELYGRAVRLARERPVSIVTAEQECFAGSHADVGGYLLGLWGLPVSVVEAIALHHSPRLSACRTFSPLTAVHLAHFLIDDKHAGGEVRGDVECDREYLEDLGLSGPEETWRQSAQSVTA